MQLMGRKIEIKKIEDVTKCQVTFSKRRSSLVKKAHEIAVCCDVDVAFVAFSPSGRISKFCNQKRIEDVFHRYIDLPIERRQTHMTNIQTKMEKLRQVDHIRGDASKLQYLEKQIENLELQITKSGLELQILEADLRDYELGPEQEPSLHQLCWTERNLKRSLQRVTAWKNSLSANGSTSNNQPTIQMEQQPPGSQFGVPFPYDLSANELENPNSTGQILMQLDPWEIPYSANEDLLLDQPNHTPNVSHGPSYNVSTLPIQDSLSIFESHSGIISTSFDAIPHQQSLLATDQNLLNFPSQINNVNSAGLGNTQHAAPSTTVPANGSIEETPQIMCDGMDQNGLQYENFEWSELANMHEEDYARNNNISVSGGNANYSGSTFDNYGIPKGNDQSVNQFRAHPAEDNFGESSLGTPKNLQEWKDFLLNDNMNLGDFTK